MLCLGPARAQLHPKFPFLSEAQVMKKLSSYLTDEDGAITVDWVILSAAAVAMAALIAGSVGDGGLSLANGIASFMRNWSFS
jgi:hypothetical protein